METPCHSALLLWVQVVSAASASPEVAEAGPEPAEAGTSQEAETNQEAGKVDQVEAPDTPISPHLQPVQSTGNLGNPPGCVLTDTTAPGETTRAQDQGTTETSPLRK